MKLITFDIETWGLEPGYTLQPWQVKNEASGILSLAAYDGRMTYVSPWCPRNNEIKGGIDSLAHASKQDVILCGWNIKFDLSFILAHGLDNFAYSYKYLDGMLLLKRMRSDLQSYALKKALKEYADVVKSEAGYNSSIEFKVGDPNVVYSEDEQLAMLEYNKLDAIYTHRLVSHLLKTASRNDIAQAMRESIAALLFADAWQRGIHVDAPKLTSYSSVLQYKLTKLRSVMDPINISPEIIRSPVKLATYLKDTLKINLKTKTKKGAYSTDKKTMKNLYYASTKRNKSIIKLILLYKEYQTENTKFVESFEKCISDDNLIHSEPILSSSYTGRMTYSTYQMASKETTLKNGSIKKSRKRIHIGVPIHQIKRKGFARHMFIAPEGHKLVELDFCAQEMRLMACLAKETTMLRLLNENKDLHAYTAAEICEMKYDAFLKLKEDAPEDYAKARFLGKLTNFSLQYRMSAKSLHRKWHDEYDLVDKTLDDAVLARDAYLRLYPNVPLYWRTSVSFARSAGYTINKAGRKHKIEFWDAENEWKSSQTAINYPIQSTGAEQKILAIHALKTCLIKNNVKLAWDLHDGLYFYVPDTKKLSSVVAKMAKIMGNLDYKNAWSWEPQTTFPVEAKVGENWGSLEVIQ